MERVNYVTHAHILAMNVIYARQFTTEIVY